jgi:type-F conjugative transfer system pilin assembly thiol-disulfide isomerase TrbB
MNSKRIQLLIAAILLCALNASFANAIVDDIHQIEAQKTSLGKWVANKGSEYTSQSTTYQAHAIIIFFKGTCPYCQRFAPVLKHFASTHHVKVFAYSIDGEGLPEYANPLSPTQQVVHTFFGNSPEITVPATFLINTHTLDVWPVSTGFESEGQFSLDYQRALNEAHSQEGSNDH